MGADLYINSLFDAHNAEWQRKFDAAVELCDSLPFGSAAREQASEEVVRCHREMYSRGYFRDSYNDSDLLWRFGLSWSDDIMPMLDGDDHLSVAAAGRLLQLLDSRQRLFEASLNEPNVDGQAYFRKKLVRLKSFLRQAIALNESIYCSL